MVGGGIVGSATAYHLARADVDTLLLDRSDEGRATDAGAGILSPATSSRTGSRAWFRFAVDAVAHYDELVPRLREEQDAPVGYAEPGLLSVAVSAAEAEAFDRALSRIRDRQARLGVPAEGTVEEITPDRARELFPALAEVRRAFHYTEAARVDGATFTDALRRAAEGHGMDLRAENAETIRVTDGEVRSVETDADTHATDSVVLTGGAWSPRFAADLDVALPVEPMRGQIAHLDATTLDDEGVASPDAWPIVSAYRDHYVVPWPDGRLAVGATREAESGYDPRATVAGVQEVLDEATRVAPGLADAGFEEVRAGLRPATPDGLPVLGPVPDVEGAYLATGHGPTGLQLGPYSGQVVADLVRGRDPGADLSPFTVERFERDGGE